jgi:hypothetical protein
LPFDHDSKNCGVPIYEFDKFWLLGHVKQAKLILRRSCQKTDAISICHLSNIMTKTDNSKKVQEYVLITLISVLHIAVRLIMQRHLRFWFEDRWRHFLN